MQTEGRKSTSGREQQGAKSNRNIAGSECRSRGEKPLNTRGWFRISAKSKRKPTGAGTKAYCTRSGKQLNRRAPVRVHDSKDLAQAITRELHHTLSQYRTPCSSIR
eukprot:1373584-Rhodomonas_salina.1